MTDQEFLKLLCCPESRQPLKPAGAGLLAALNREIQAGRLRNRGGAAVGEALEAGYVRQDGKWVYPIRNGIPVLLMDEGLPAGG